MIEIDGAQGEGGGQMLRSALTLSICTRKPFRIFNLRANRTKPGLMRQHLTAVRAAAQICNAEAVGAEIGSRDVTFHPGTVRPGRYTFEIGTAGSCTLVLQTVLLPLVFADGPSEVHISGGTHNKASPPIDFLQRAFLPLLVRMGMEIGLNLDRYGFYPKGGGSIRASIGPATQLSRIDLHERGARVNGIAEAYVAALPIDIAQRELYVIGKSLNWGADQLKLRGLPSTQGPGNAVTITLEYEHITEVFTGFGERGVRAEAVAESAAREARTYLAQRAPVGEHLADQVLLPLALGAGGSFTATACSQHLRTNAMVVEAFTERKIEINPVEVGYRVMVPEIGC